MQDGNQTNISRIMTQQVPMTSSSTSKMPPSGKQHNFNQPFISSQLATPVLSSKQTSSMASIDGGMESAQEQSHYYEQVSVAPMQEDNLLGGFSVSDRKSLAGMGSILSEASQDNALQHARRSSEVSRKSGGTSKFGHNFLRSSQTQQKDNVKVVIRVRPMCTTDREKSKYSVSIVQAWSVTSTCLTIFKFDCIRYGQLEELSASGEK